MKSIMAAIAGRARGQAFHQSCLAHCFGGAGGFGKGMAFVCGAGAMIVRVARSNDLVARSGSCVVAVGAAAGDDGCREQRSHAHGEPDSSLHECVPFEQ